MRNLPDSVAVDYAGVIAQVRAAPSMPTGGSSGDRKNAWAKIKTMFPTHKERLSFKKLQQARAKAILDERWHLVGEVAEALVEHSFIHYDQFFDIVRYGSCAGS
jgi:hypothetical protein